MTEIREIQPDDVRAIPAVDGGPAWHGGEAKWRDYLDQHQRGLRVCLIATESAAIAGYGSLVWLSQYPAFATAGIPEVQDMVVAQHHRRGGIATQMITAFEKRARAKGHRMLGIGVGLYPDYGSAQRLYARLGYAPDGRGITFNNRTVAAGETIVANDELILWLSKSL
jgi:GNAT superfamily N-acetyltransferase